MVAPPPTASLSNCLPGAFLLGKGLDPAQPATLPNAVVAVMQSLPFREAAGQAREKEVEAAAELCLALHSLASTEFPSTVDSDIHPGGGGPLAPSTMAGVIGSSLGHRPDPRMQAEWGISKKEWLTAFFFRRTLAELPGQ